MSQNFHQLYGDKELDDPKGGTILLYWAPEKFKDVIRVENVGHSEEWSIYFCKKVIIKGKTWCPLRR